MTHFRFAFAILLAAHFLAAPASVSGKLMSLPYSVYGNYSYGADVVDDHYGYKHNGIDDGAAPYVGAGDVVEYNSGIQQAGVGPFVTGPLESTSADVTVKLHGQVGSFKISTDANAYSTRITNDCPYCKVNSTAHSEGTLGVADWVEFSSKTASSMIVNTQWTISFNDDTDENTSVIGTYHDQSLIGGDDYTWAEARSFLNVTGTGIAPGPYANVPDSINARGYAYYWKIQGGYDSPPAIDHIDGPPPASIPISFKITKGVPLHVSWTFNVESYAQVINDDLTPGSGTAHSSFDFTHTANWGGITSVIDADTGEPVTDWTMDSASGFDYVHPFVEPEPASIVLAAIGAIAFAAVARRKSIAQRLT
jgi:hypothetical protein